MADDKRDVEAMLRACAEHTWDDKRHKRDFEAIGIRSAPELEALLSQKVRDPQTRSFDRLPDADRPHQSEKSTFFHFKHTDRQGKEHQITAVLNPDRDERGKLHGGTALLADPARKRTFFDKKWEREHEKGRDPQILLRGRDLGLSEDQAKKSPVSRLDRGLGNLPKPTLEREKQVTPSQERQEQGRKTKEQMTVLQRLKQAKPDISRELGERDRQRQMSRSHELGR